MAGPSIVEKTPKPWHFEKYGLQDAAGDYIPLASPWQEDVYTAEDAEIAAILALIVTAVNEYDALKTVETAAHGAISRERLRGRNCECKPTSGCDAAVAEQNLIVALAALDALRGKSKS